jgi:outer membrane lipoprotein LolB
LISVVLLSACRSTIPVTIEEPERIRLYMVKSDQLSHSGTWSLEGRLAVSDESDGGSGKFRWATDIDGVQMDFHGALGRGAWKLRADTQSAVLTLADGNVYREGSIEQLVRQQLGWEIPVENLSWWVRGLLSPGHYHERDIDGSGDITRLVQNDWTVEYDRYREFNGIRLPVKLVAHRENWTVKLVIRDWEMPGEVGADE